jgi:lysophospholipase L1-like esterase
MKLLTFNGKNNIVIESGKEIYSDTIFYPLKALSDIAVSIFFGSVPKELSGHAYSLTYSYIETGNKVQNKKFNIRNKVDHWYFISAIEISSESPKKTIVCFGDSITDGVIFRGDIRDNYPDILFSRLHQNNEASNLSIVNEGINGDRITDQGTKRYEHDVLNIKGVAYIIVLYGVNDLNVIKANSTEIIAGYKKIIQKAHERNILIYAGTITPFANYRVKYLWNKNKEKVRKEANEWIRTTKPEDGGFDAFIDFDKLLRDPNNETILFKKYDCKDGIHPGYEGNKKMVEGIIDLSLFSKKPSFKNY